MKHAAACIVTLSLFSAQAFAQGTSEETLKKKETFKMGLYGDTYTPGLSHLNEHVLQNPNGTPSGDAANLYTFIYAQYYFSPTRKISVSNRYTWEAGGTGVTLMDTRVGFVMSKLIESGGFTFASLALQTELPTSTASYDAGKIVALRTPMTMEYSMSRFTLGSDIIPRLHIYSGSSKGHRNDFDLGWAPYAKYRVSEKVETGLYFEEAYNYRVTASGSAFSQDPWDVRATLWWDPIAGVSINPYIRFYPGTPTIASTSLGLEADVSTFLF